MDDVGVFKSEEQSGGQGYLLMEKCFSGFEDKETAKRSDDRLQQDRDEGMAAKNRIQCGEIKWIDRCSHRIGFIRLAARIGKGMMRQQIHGDSVIPGCITDKEFFSQDVIFPRASE